MVTQERYFDPSKMAHLDIEDDYISMSAGIACESYLPNLHSFASHVLATDQTVALQYGPTAGNKKLLKLILWLSDQFGIVNSTDQLMLTNGAKDAISIVCRALFDEDTIVIVPSPTYLTAIPIFRRTGAKIVPINQDNMGIDVDILAERLSQHSVTGKKIFLYLVPEFDNPTGSCLPLSRRQKIADLVEDFDITLIEDDPYRYIRFLGEALPPISALLTPNRYIYIGTTSKILAPGLRFGWICTSTVLIELLIQYKDDGCGCSLSQLIVARAFETGYAQSFTKNLSERLTENRDALIRGLYDHLPDAVFEIPQGGYFLWVTLPNHVDTAILASIAHKNDISFFPGYLCFPTDPCPKNQLRLAVSCGKKGIEINQSRLLKKTFWVLISSIYAVVIQQEMQ